MNRHTVRGQCREIGQGGFYGTSESSRPADAKPTKFVLPQNTFSNKIEYRPATPKAVTVILVDSLRVWTGILRGTREVRISEAPFVLSQLQAEEL